MAMTLAALVKDSLPSVALNGCFVPENNNKSYTDEAELSTVTITDSDEKLVAFGAAQKLNAKMVYCSVNAVSNDYKNHTLWVENVSNKEEKTIKNFKVVKSVPYEVQPDHQNQFESVFADSDGKPAFEHVFDQLVDTTIGLNRLGTDKNVTVDVYSEDEEQLRSALEQWTKTGGTIVGDRFSFLICEINRFELLGLENDNSKVTLEKINDENLLDIFDYDAEVSIFDREKHVAALIATPGVFGFMARRDNQVTGYALGMANRILQCYGEDEETVRQLLSTLAAEIMSPEVTLCTREETGATMNELINRAGKVTKSVRLHTRSQPTGIKWSKVACPNVGVAIF